MEPVNQKHLHLTLGIAVLGACILRMPTDDALRHVGLAFGDFSGWGGVYPYSVFEKLGDFNPWCGYDLTLRTIARGLLHILPNEVMVRGLFVKTIALAFGSLFFYLIMRASGLGGDVKDKHSFALAGVLLVLLLPAFLRILICRPFAFGTFFLVYSCHGKGFIKGAAAAALLTFFYPYLAWFYVFPAAAAHIFAGDKKFASGCLAVAFVFLLFAPLSFWGFQIELFLTGAKRSMLDAQIGEFMSTFKFLWFYAFLILILLSGPALFEGGGRSRVALWLLLIYAVPALKYVRYFIDISLPLFFVAYARSLLAYWMDGFKRIQSYWAGKLSSLPLPRTRPTGALKPALAAAYLIVFSLLIYQGGEQIRALSSFREKLEDVPQGAVVLTDFNLQYATLFVRPDIKLVPSCEICFATEYISREYKAFMDYGIIAPLAKKTGARFLLENRKLYLDPEEAVYLNTAFRDEKLSVWKIVNT